LHRDATEDDVREVFAKIGDIYEASTIFPKLVCRACPVCGSHNCIDGAWSWVIAAPFDARSEDGCQ